MSCQQAARLLTKNTSARIREDPYVFSETVPTTPPILFNLQKSRAKLPKLVTTTAKLANHKQPLAQLNGFVAKTQASSANVASNTILTTTTTAATNFKNVSQSQQQITKSTNSNVCIVRPQPHIQHTTLPTPTPSLWQTPLLLDTIVSPPTSPASLPSPTPANLTSITVSSATLPPSNFHHTTFAQHLQKVGCIRKTPIQVTQPLKEKLNSNIDIKKVNCINSDAVAYSSDLIESKLASQKSSSSSSPPLESLQHSVNDLNDIPVNVIYRKPQPAIEVVASTTQVATPQIATANGNSPKVKPQATVSAQKHNNSQPDSPTKEISKPELFKENFIVQPNLKRDFLLPSSANRNDTTLTVSLESAEAVSAPTSASSNISKKEKSLQTDVVLFSTPQTQKRRINRLTGKQTSQQQINKKNRQLPASFLEHQTRAYAVVTYPERGGFSSALADSKSVPYCLQKHWLGVYELKSVGGSLPPTCISVKSPNIGREDRIAQHKNILRRQAVQLLATQKLLRCPLRVARRRLICVDKLLRKYGNHSENGFDKKSCVFGNCSNQVLPMTTNCYDHIGYNVDQHLFLTCTAKFSNNSQCRIPVFDIVHDLPLCTEHARKRDAYNRIWHEQRPRKMSTTAITAPSITSCDDELKRIQQQQQPQIHHAKTSLFNNNNSSVTKTQRNKRKITSGMKPIGRPQKRFRKTYNSSTPAPLPLSAIKHRKSSNTSLESIASNSHSSHSQPPFITSATTANVVLAPPALAPLSGGNAGRHHLHAYQQQQHHKHHENIMNLGVGQTSLSINRMLNFGGASVATTNEINQIVAQFAMIANDNNSNSHTDFSSGLSSLPSADEILTQDMLSICENSSAYASSEDTGVGGLSETELMAGAHDAEEIPLGDTRLLEEHDLANVLNTLPVDAFNELFTAVRQDERDEVERALEMAENNLKSLQQTIGSDSDFLGDFLDVHDHMLDEADICSKMEIVSSVLHSPDTSGIDTATLFAEGGSNSGDGGRSCMSTITDIRGLVQT